MGRGPGVQLRVSLTAPRCVDRYSRRSFNLESSVGVAAVLGSQGFIAKTRVARAAGDFATRPAPQRGTDGVTQTPTSSST